VWLPDPIGGYSVRGAYDLLTAVDYPHVESALDLVWHRQVPLKVSIFAWRLIRDHLPTKANLTDRGMLQPEATMCVSGCGLVETADHMFLSCSSLAPLWEQVRQWIGFVGVDPNNIPDHLMQYTFMTGVGKAKSSFLQLVWLLCTCVLWNERNNKLFNNVVSDIPRLLDKIKLLPLAWLKAKKAIFVFGTHRWWSSHLTCLGIG